MQQVVEVSAEQRGDSGAQFFETARHDFPPLAPLVRALHALRNGPGLSGRYAS